MLSYFSDIEQNHNQYENAHIRRVSRNSAMTKKHGIEALSSILDAMKRIHSPPVDSCSEYHPNDYSNLEESKADGLSYSPIKVLALTLQSYIARTYLATDVVHCFYFVELPLA